MWNVISNGIKKAIDTVFWEPVNYIRRKFFLNSISTAFLDRDIATVKRHIELGENPQVTNECQSNALHLAARCTYDPELVDFLVKKGVALEAKNDMKETPLTSSLKEHNYPFAKKLILEYKVNVNSKDSSLDSSLMGFLLASDKTSEVKNVLSILIDKGLDINDIYYNGDTILHRASRANNLHLVNALIEKGADPMIRNDQGDTVLDVAVKESHSKLSKVLMKYEQARGQKSIAKGALKRGDNWVDRTNQNNQDIGGRSTT